MRNQSAHGRCHARNSRGSRRGHCPGRRRSASAFVAATDKLKLEGDEQIGVNIVKRAITEPLRQIAENAGEEGAIVTG